MICSNCSQEMKMIPAGVSKKTGKAYRAFEVCETPACKALAEQKRMLIPSAARPSFDPTLQNQVNDLHVQIGELNVTIAKMRTAFANHEERIKTLETLSIDLKGKDAFNIHSSPDQEIPTIDSNNLSKMNIEFPEGFLKQ